MGNTVVDRIRERARAFPGSVALVDGDHAISFAELFDRVDRLSRALADRGLSQGDAVLAFLPNVHEAVECELAVLQSGLVWITLTARLTWAEVRGVIVSCRPRLVVTSPEGKQKIAEGQRVLPLDPLPEVVVTGDPYEGLVSGAKGPRPEVTVGDDDAARLRYTSGTTGSAKAAVLPHRVYHASLDNLLEVLAPVTAADRALHVAPLTHGSGALLYPVLHAGGTSYLSPHFDPEGVLAAVERDRITTLFTVPTMLSRLVASPDVDTRDLRSLRALVYGGAPMPEARLRAAAEKLGPALFHIYGMTEAPWPITVLRPEDHVLGGERLRAIGKPTSVCELRIVDEGGEEVAPGVVGEIQIRGRNVMSGYFEDPEATAEAMKSGWLCSGDSGRRDADGYYFIVGRQKDVVISGGFNVYAAEVELALSSHDAVLEAAVVGLPHDDWGEIVAAFVVPKPGAVVTSAEIDAVARRLLSGYKCPRRIEIVADLPRTATGKILKSEIVRLALAGPA